MLPLAISTAVPAATTAALAVLILTAAYRLIFRGRVGEDMEADRRTAVGELDWECSSCGELFDDPELAEHHVSTRHPRGAATVVDLGGDAAAE